MSSLQEIFVLLRGDLMKKQLLKASEVAAVTGLSVDRIYELTRKRQIPFILVGDRQYRYPEAMILSWCSGEWSFETSEQPPEEGESRKGEPFRVITSQV